MFHSINERASRLLTLLFTGDTEVMKVAMDLHEKSRNSDHGASMKPACCLSDAAKWQYLFY